LPKKKDPAAVRLGRKGGKEIADFACGVFDFSDPPLTADGTGF